jgi:hypothetical protein
LIQAQLSQFHPIDPSAMKTLFAMLSLLFVPLQTSQADVTDDLIGKWTGTSLASYKDGRKIKSSFIDVTRRFQSQGFITRSTLTIPGKPLTKVVMRHYDSGKVRGTIVQGGQTLALINGTWQINDNTLKVRSKVSTLAGNYSQTARSVLVSKKRLSSLTVATNGIRTVSTAVKK